MVRSRILTVLTFSLVWFVVGIAQSQARSDRVKGARPFESSAETVDLFQAIEEGTLSVKVIPRDAKQCRVFITNETRHPVNVQMPGALAAVPVLAQLPPLGPAPAQDNSSTPQRLGIGNPFGQQNPLQMGPNMQGGPLMNRGNQPFFAPFCIEPEKVAQLRLPSVCLDYGHPDPRPAIRYQLVPVTAVSEGKELELLCCQLGRAPASQRVAQAVAWHFSDGKSWKELESLIVHRLGRPDELFFTSPEIERAKSFADALAEVDKGAEKKIASSVASAR